MHTCRAMAFMEPQSCHEKRNWNPNPSLFVVPVQAKAQLQSLGWSFDVTGYLSCENNFRLLLSIRVSKPLLSCAEHGFQSSACTCHEPANVFVVEYHLCRIGRGRVFVQPGSSWWKSCRTQACTCCGFCMHQLQQVSSTALLRGSVAEELRWSPSRRWSGFCVFTTLLDQVPRRRQQ